MVFFSSSNTDAPKLKLPKFVRIKQPGRKKLPHLTMPDVVRSSGYSTISYSKFYDCNQNRTEMETFKFNFYREIPKDSRSSSHFFFSVSDPYSVGPTVRRERERASGGPTVRRKRVRGRGVVPP